MRPRGDAGQTSPEYLGLVLVIGVVIAGILSLTPASAVAIATGVEKKVCEIAGLDSCADKRASPTRPTPPPKATGMTAADVIRIVREGGIRAGTGVSPELLRDEKLFNFLLDHRILPVPETFLNPCSGPAGIGVMPCAAPDGKGYRYQEIAARWFNKEVRPAAEITLAALALWSGSSVSQPAAEPAQEEELQALRQEFAQLLHRRELGFDAATKSFRLDEADLGSRLEAQLGTRLSRSTERGIDWVDTYRRTYDGVGSAVTSNNFDFEELSASVRKHLLRSGLDKVVLDVSRIAPSQAAQMAGYVSHLPSADQARVMILEH